MLKQNRQTKSPKLSLNKKAVATLTINQQQMKLIAGGYGLGCTSLPGGGGGTFCTTNQPPTTITIFTVVTTDGNI
jgi:hypothetical protein